MFPPFSEVVPEMAALHDTSMAGEEDNSVESTLLNTISGGTHTNRDLLRELQGSIHFEKILTPSNVPNGIPNSRCSLEIPPWFVEKHGGIFEEYVILRCATSAQPRAPTVVRISVSAFPVVRMSCGWNKFAAFNGLREGDSLVFCLRALSEFEVYVFPGNGHPIPSPFSLTTPVDTFCEPMVRIMSFGKDGRTVSGSRNNFTFHCNASHSTYYHDFIMENARVSALRTSRFPPSGHAQERTVSAGDIGSVWIDATGNNDPSSGTIGPMPSMRFLFV